MLGWLQALFLDSKARESLSRAKAAARVPAPAAPAAKAPVRAGKPAAKAVSRPSAPPAAATQSADRATLLREAAAIHRAKRKILDALSDEDRAKLLSMAILTFLNQGTEPPPDPKTRK